MQNNTNDVSYEEIKARLNALFGITIREHDILYEDTDSVIVKVTENRGEEGKNHD